MQWGWQDPNRSLRLAVRRLELENSILIGREVYHHLEQGGPAVAWSVGNEIHFNSVEIPPPDTPETIVLLSGINKHELAHVLFTPTMSDMWRIAPGEDGVDGVAKLKTDYTYMAAWNILEDQRIEMMLIARYRTAKPYLMKSFEHVALSDAAELDKAYILARGRRYLPVRLRRMLMRKFKVRSIVPDIRRIVDAYLKLELFRPSDLRTAFRLASEFETLLIDNGIFDQKKTESQKLDCCKVVEGWDRLDSEGVKQSGSHGQNIDSVERAAIAEDIASALEAERDTEDVPDDSAGGGGRGSSSGIESVKPADVIAQAVKAVMADAEVQREVRATQVYIRSQPDIDSVQIKEWGPVPARLPGIARRIATRLRRLEVDVDPSWDRRTNSGRLNIQRLMTNPDDRDHAFDRWEDGGSGGNDQEWVVLLDCSGSMSSQLARLSQAAWVLKKASDIIRATTTVLAYGSDHENRIIYKPKDRAMGNALPGMPGFGGTEPRRMLEEAYGLLVNSRKAHRGLLVLTDGEWFGGGAGNVRSYKLPFKGHNDVIKDMGARGVHTHLVYLGYGSAVKDLHGCKAGTAIQNVDDLVSVMENLIGSHIKK